MKIAAAIVTERGGRTCHAAIVARELGVPAVVGAAGAKKALKTGSVVTVSCAEGEAGRVYDGSLPFETTRVEMTDIKRPRTAIMLNLGNPELAFRTAMLPNDGVGLARMEFIISEHIGVHPMALVHPEKVTSKQAQRAIQRAGAQLPAPIGLLHRKAVGRRGRDRRRILSQARDRPAFGFQDQRIRQADRRRRLRAEGREPDARVPRGGALCASRPMPPALRSNAPRCAASARTWG